MENMERLSDTLLYQVSVSIENGVHRIVHIVQQQSFNPYLIEPLFQILILMLHCF